MIDDSGNITIQRGADTILTFRFRDISGEYLDLTDARVRLEVRGRFAIDSELAQDPTRRRIVFHESHAAQLGSKPVQYQILRAVTPGDTRAPMSGTITAVGFSSDFEETQ